MFSGMSSSSRLDDEMLSSYVKGVTVVLASLANDDGRTLAVKYFKSYKQGLGMARTKCAKTLYSTALRRVGVETHLNRIFNRLGMSIL